MASCTSSKPNANLAKSDDGYLQTDRKKRTTSVSEIEQLDVSRSLDMHLSTIAGVMVAGQGPGAQIRVQGGQNSFSGDTEPLFVLDGQAISGGFSAIYSAVAVPDIATISVLKGSAASIYGTRGANGVIVIRTKG